MGVTKFDIVQADEFRGAMTADTGSVGTAELADLAVTAAKMAADAVETAKILDGAVTPAKSAQLEAVTATVDGLTTGLISVTARHVSVTSSVSTKIVTLPASVVGKEITGYVGSNGFQLQTTAASNITINGVDSDGTSFYAVPANSFFYAKCVSATAWLVYTVSSTGTLPAASLADGSIMTAKLRTAEARTATADGTTTGAITTPTSHITVVTVTSANATDQIALPAISAATIGQVIYLNVAANGYELITPASSNNTINLVDSDGTNQLDVAANTTVRCTQVSSTSWLAETIAATTIAVTAPDND